MCLYASVVVIIQQTEGEKKRKETAHGAEMLKRETTIIRQSCAHIRRGFDLSLS